MTHLESALNTLWFQTSGGVTLYRTVWYCCNGPCTAVDADLDCIQVLTQLSLSLRQEHGRVLVLYKKERLCVQSMSAQYGHHHHYYYYLYHRYKYKYLYLKYRDTVSKSVASFSAKWTSICCIAQAKQSSPDRRIVS